ncbi:MAG TPA: biotin/lipoyl-binding protein [Stellaceae bacterium]|nr:biotin/lipoyl-binding protein [Stellaceae bacterium]
MKRFLPFFAVFALCAGSARGEEATVMRQTIDDRKAVIATVEPQHELVARARIGGTVSTLAIKEGDRVAAGDRIAVIADQKLLLQIAALDSRIAAQQAERAQAQIDLARAQELRRSGVVSQAALDQAKTRLDVAERTLQALRGDRQVIEGRVIADVEVEGLGDYFVGERTRV